MPSLEDKEKYSAKDLEEVFRISDSDNVKVVLDRIAQSKAVKYFVNKKKSDTGTFLKDVIGSLSDYVNVEKIAANGTISLDNMAKAAQSIDVCKGKWLYLFHMYDKNKLLDGKKISLIATIRNKKLKGVLKSFFRVIVKKQSWFGGKIYNKFYLKSIACEIINTCNNLKIDKYVHPKGGLKIYADGNTYSKEKVLEELKNVYSPLSNLISSIRNLRSKVALSDNKIELFAQIVGLGTQYAKSSGRGGDPFSKENLQGAANTLAVGREVLYGERKVNGQDFATNIFDLVLAYLSAVLKKLLDKGGDVLSGFLSITPIKSIWHMGNKNLKAETAAFYRKFWLAVFENDCGAFLTLIEAVLFQWLEDDVFGQEKSELGPILRKSELCDVINDTIKRIFDTRYKSFLDQIAEYMAIAKIELYRETRKSDEKAKRKEKKKGKIPKAFKPTEY